MREFIIVLMTAFGVVSALAMEQQVATRDPIVSAEVILAPASGASLESASITAKNVKNYAPAQETVDTARGHFEKAGFRTGELSGISFTISAPQSVFESVFGTKIAAGKKSAGKSRAQASAPEELPLARLPASVRRGIKAVSFSRPLDFGPTGSYSY